MLALTGYRRETIRPSADLVRAGAPPEIIRESYHDSNGTQWVHHDIEQPFICSWCGRWYTGTAYIAPPIVACSKHFDSPRKTRSKRAQMSLLTSR